ncbi:3-isopropylmalate dehydratase large subunit [Bordetella genomosp. 4]|uniref:3-isopropylmalate dehydratase n=1 Tax=Bordetella genomosp. 4 TaxID=463044 RepID=A0A261TYH3_9BORD|nr:3-isopropylmalate dehydratase large subunit [Bordetella genomosp. 4]OZI49362.1 3-isopropylmalate dehydratase [Bordetella genomosp. 4]OZI54734.1 3-isopropylmalate dehydratase [Bordetella genomosp. 4]
MMKQTLAQKLIAAASGRDTVAEGEIVTCSVDLAMFHDSSGPRRLEPMLRELGATIWDRDKVVLVIDHYVPESDDESRRIVRIARDWARSERLPHVYDSQGICHVVVPQGGHLRPGMFCVGGDSHSPTGGAFGAYMFGVGSTEMLGVVVTGQIWVKVPRTLMMRWNGRLADGVTAKDMMLHLIGRYGMNGGQYQAVEFCGEAVRALSMPERMTLSNMSAELGSQVGLVAPDETTAAWLREVGVTEPLDVQRWHSDEGCDAEWYDFDASALAPQVAAPHSPANARDAGSYRDIAVQAAYIGACTGAKLEDLRAAARVLRGKRLADGMRLIVAPASMKDQAAATQEGVMQVLTDAGAQVLPTTCGACAGYGGSIPDGATVISSTARNFKGRMGSESAQVYLGSPYSVAAAAVAGRIIDPREVMQ